MEDKEFNPLASAVSLLYMLLQGMFLVAGINFFISNAK